MNLTYKPDWEQTKNRYLQWWAGEDFGRCGLSIYAPREGICSDPPQIPEKIEDRWLDLEYLCKQNQHHMASTFYGGEAIPVWNAGYPGWDFISAFLGCPVDLMETTGWVHPIMTTESLVDYPWQKLKIEPDQRWWQFGCIIHQLAASESHGKSIPGIQAIGGVGDVLAGLRGTDRLLMDVMDCPDDVRRCELHLMDIWIDVFETFFQLTTAEADGGCSNFFHMWAPGRFYPTANDFSYMISSNMYEEIFLPALRKQLAFLDHTIYHVDGVDAFRHVDLLCALPEIDCLQILPGANKPSPLYYMDILKKVQAAGKKLNIWIRPDEIELALNSLSSRGLFIVTFCDREEDARSLLKLAERWSRWI